MAIDAAAAQSRIANGASQVERSSVRAPIQPVRPISPGDAFQNNLSGAQAAIGKVLSNAQKSQQTPTSKGLLSTNTQLLLAETRTQEAGGTFVPASSIGRALEQYAATQTKIRETIREAAAFTSSREASQISNNADQTSATTGVKSPAATEGEGIAGSALPISSIAAA